jgi:hypothetical protein
MPEKTFQIILKYDSDDEDIFGKWTKPSDLRQLQADTKKAFSRFAGPPVNADMTIDHKDRDIFNNVKSNLQWATRRQQDANRNVQRNNTSGHTGVFKIQKGKYRYWEAKIGSRKSVRNGSAPKPKPFPFTDKGFDAAILWYHKQALAFYGPTWICESCSKKKELQPVDKTGLVSDRLRIT